jgi:hypothetical protein
MDANWHHPTEVNKLLKHFVVWLVVAELLPKGLAPGFARFKRIPTQQNFWMLRQQMSSHVGNLQGSRG